MDKTKKEKSIAKELHEVQKDGSDFEEEKITCDCDECDSTVLALEGEVAGHTELCACYTCHHHYGKLR